MAIERRAVTLGSAALAPWMLDANTVKPNWQMGRDGVYRQIRPDPAPPAAPPAAGKGGGTAIVAALAVAAGAAFWFLRRRKGGR